MATTREVERGNKHKLSLKEGQEYTLRLIESPLNEDGGDPFLELFFHFDVANSSMLCLEKNYDEECPVCDFGRSLWKSGTEEDKELAKKMFPKQRFFAVVVDRDDESMTPKYWGFGQKVYMELLDKLRDEEYMNYLDPMEGLDVVVKMEKLKGKKYPDTSLTFKRRETKLAPTRKKVDEVLNSIPDYKEALSNNLLTAEEIKSKLDAWLSFGENNTEEVTRGDVNLSKPSKANGHAESASSSEEGEEADEIVEESDIDNALAQAMAELED